MAKLNAVSLLALLAGCVTPAPPNRNPVGGAYYARGQEPGWTLRIANGRIEYVGNYGDKHITVPRPDPRRTFTGYRYETARIAVDINRGRCNDAMSGQGFTDQVVVSTDGETYRGCGGNRRPDWDQ
jgi:uncharacterized membrane protein